MFSGPPLPICRLPRRPTNNKRTQGVYLVPCLLAAASVLSCGQTLDAGSNQYGILPVDEHNPVILLNDSWSDNWSPEYAALFATHGGPPLAGIVVNATEYWPDLDANLAGWRTFVTAARDSGMRGIPDPIRSDAAQLVVPPDRLIASTHPNHSAGAELIVRRSRELALPGQPLVVLSGSQLTDVADAYLIDPSVVDRVLVVAQLGAYVEPKGTMAGPNGDLDPWADWIVAQCFSYVQISVYYDQGADVTADDLGRLPATPFGAWMSAKQAKISRSQNAADQEAILAVAAPSFLASVVTSKADTSSGFNVPPGQGPPLVPSDTGNAWLVKQIDPSVPRARMWEMLSSSASLKSR
jgi:hypothetical protein